MIAVTSVLGGGTSSIADCVVCSLAASLPLLRGGTTSVAGCVVCSLAALLLLLGDFVCRRSYSQLLGFLFTDVGGGTSSVASFIVCSLALLLSVPI